VHHRGLSGHGRANGHGGFVAKPDEGTFDPDREVGGGQVLSPTPPMTPAGALPTRSRLGIAVPALKLIILSPLAACTGTVARTIPMGMLMRSMSLRMVEPSGGGRVLVRLNGEVIDAATERLESGC